MKKVKIDNIFYYAAFALILVTIMCSQFAFISNNRKYIRAISIIFLIINLILQNQKIPFKSFVILIVSFVCLSISYFINESYTLLLGLCFILCYKNIDINNFMKFDMKLKIFLLVFVIVSWKLGIVSEVTMLRTDGTIRHSLGFSHPNSLGLNLFCICAEIIYLYFEKLKLKHYFLIALSLYICNNICDSRSATLSLLILFGLFLLKKFNLFKPNKNLKYLPVLLIALSFIFSIFFLKNPNNVFLKNLNHLISGRIRCSAEFLDYYGLNMFGHKFEFYGLWNVRGQKLTVLDNSYMYLFLHYGIVNGLIITLYVISFINKLLKNEEYSKICYLISFLFIGLMENVTFNVFYNVILICMLNNQFQKRRKI